MVAKFIGFTFSFSFWLCFLYFLLSFFLSPKLSVFKFNFRIFDVQRPLLDVHSEFKSLSSLLGGLSLVLERSSLP